MADEQQELRRVNWNEVFSVTHVFKSFRMAIHFGKLGLALAALLLIGLWGLALDTVSGWAGVYVPDGEIYAWAVRSDAGFEQWTKAAETQRVTGAVELHQKAMSLASKYGNPFLENLTKAHASEDGQFRISFMALFDANAPAPPNLDAVKKKAAEDWSASVSEANEAMESQLSRIDTLIAKAHERASAKVKQMTEGKEAAETKLTADVDAARTALARTRTEMTGEFCREAQRIRGRKVFAAFTEYEGRCLAGALAAVWHWEWTGGLASYRAARAAGPGGALGLPAAVPGQAEELGFLFFVLMALNGLAWLVSMHWLFAIFFLGIALAIWALFGGAISRIAALHFARDEKISITQALRFSISKFLNFYTAPLIPLAIIVVLGLLLALGGLILAWPGGILMGILLPLAVVGGLLIAFLLIGLLGGGCLMYPTIAVESSDSFDAISRSYSYLFSRPWRAAAYSVIALIYGVVCYLFVRLFIYIALAATRLFVQFGVIGGGGKISPAADKLDVLWPPPSFNNLVTWPDWTVMSGSEPVGAFLIWLWLVPVAGLVLAFLLSFYVSASTIIYYLLRQKVDATDLDDVYVEEPEEEPIAPPPAGGEAPAEPPAAAAPAEPTEEPAPKPKRARKKPAEAEESAAEEDEE